MEEERRKKMKARLGWLNLVEVDITEVVVVVGMIGRMAEDMG